MPTWVAVVLIFVSLAITFTMGAYSGASGVMFPLFKPSKLKLDIVTGAASDTDAYLAGITANDEVISAIEITGGGATPMSFRKMSIPDSLYNVESDSVAFYEATTNDTILVLWCDVDG